MKNNRAIMSRGTGFILLEVVIALGLLVFGMALLGARLQHSIITTYETDDLARVVFLAESKLSELDTGLITPEQDIEHDFGRLFPRYGWRMKILPTSGSAGALSAALTGGGAGTDIGMLFIQMEILRDPTRTVDDAFDFENAEVVQRYYTMRAPPRSLDLSVDFGLKQEIADKMNDDLAGTSAGDIDVHNLDPSMFAQLDLDQLKDVLPIMMQAFGVNASDFMNMVPENLRGQLQAWLDAMGDTNSNGEGGAGGGGGGGGGAGGGSPNDNSGRSGNGSLDQGRHPRDRNDNNKAGGDKNDNAAPDKDGDNDNRPGRPNRGGNPGGGGMGVGGKPTSSEPGKARNGSRPPVSGRSGGSKPQ